MFKTIKIENFRGFRSFQLEQLGRVNLLVGKNNSGKTSILEAVQLLCSRTNLEPLSESMKSRGEYFWGDSPRSNREFDISHLFYGHELEPGKRFSISGINDNRPEQLIVSIDVSPISPTYDSSVDRDVQLSLFNEENSFLDFTVKWNSGNEKDNFERPLSTNGGLAEDYIRRWRGIGIPKKKSTKTQFITSSSLTTEKMIELFQQVVLWPEEKLVYEALQKIEPKIDRIAAVSSDRYRSLDSRGGFLVRLSDSNQPVPIGSMGDGIWRMLGLALATVCAEGGFLFVDEIDTGLHFTVMFDMWKLICQTAKKLNVQVFATTHNSDCWTSLASIASQEDEVGDGITIQRIERGKETGVVFDEREIVIAAERGIEVR